MDTLWRWVSGSVPSNIVASQIGAQTSFRPLPDSDSKISSSYIYGICEYLRYDRQVTELILSGSGIGDGGCKPLGQVLLSNQALTRLTADRSSIGDSGCQSLLEGLERNYVLTELNLSGNKIGGRGAGVLASALKSNRSLRILDLSSSFNATDENRIGDEGAASFGQVIAVNNVLVSLNFSGRNEITARGIGALAQGLSMATCGLQFLDLSGNNLGLGGAQAIARALKVNRSLLELRLSNCSLSDDGIAEIARALREHQHITQIDLSENDIGSHGGKELGRTAAEIREIASYGVFGSIIASVRARAPVLDLTSLRHPSSSYGLNEPQIDVVGLCFLNSMLRPPKEENVENAPPPLAATYFATAGVPPPRVADGLIQQQQQQQQQPQQLGDPLMQPPPVSRWPSSGNSSASATPSDVTSMVQYQWAPPSAGVPVARDDEQKRDRDVGPLYTPQSIILNNAFFPTRHAGEELCQLAINCADSLQDLQLRNTSLSDDSLAPLISALANQQLPLLASLDLSSDGAGPPNLLTDVAATALAGALQGCACLSSLRLGGNRLSEAGANVLKNAAAQKPHLTQLDVPIGVAPQYIRQSHHILARVSSHSSNSFAPPPPAHGYGYNNAFAPPPPMASVLQPPPSPVALYGAPPPMASALQPPPSPAGMYGAPPPMYSNGAPPPAYPTNSPLPSYNAAPPPLHNGSGYPAPPPMFNTQSMPAQKPPYFTPTQ